MASRAHGRLIRLRRSLNEIEARLLKAAQGAGLPVGLAEDVARAGRLLHARGLDGCGAAWAALQGAPPWPLLPDMESGSPVFRNARVAVCGPSALDLLAAGQESGQVLLLDPDSPLLMAGMAMVAFRAGVVDAQIRFDGEEESLAASEMLAGAGAVPSCAAEILLTRRNAPSRPNLCRADDGIVDGVEVDDEVWAHLDALAAKTCVPASGRSSASGAGAGEIDND